VFLSAQRPLVGRIISLFSFKEERHPETPEFSQAQAMSLRRAKPSGFRADYSQGS
jgi:hypothetical protein